MLTFFGGILIVYSLVLVCEGNITYYTFNQTLDHFNSSDGRTFSQQYQIYSDFYQKGAPIFLIVGPERSIYPNEIYLSSVFSYFAPSLNAFIIATEHRYYGKSLPFGSSSYYLESLKYLFSKRLYSINFNNKNEDIYPYFQFDTKRYLTINQSVADYAAIVSWVKENSTYASLFSPSTPVIAVGGSYGGFLSALLRIQHPVVFLGSLASCTVPYLWALPNQGALWLELVSDAYLQQWTNSTCYDSLDSQFSALTAAVNSDHGASIQTSLNLCEAPAISTYWKLANFIKVAFTNIVEFNYPSPEVFCVERPFDVLCSSIQANVSGGNQWFGVLNALQLYYNRSGGLQCFEWASSTPSLPTGCRQSRSNGLSIIGNEDIDISKPMYDPWLYQSCTEFVYGAYGGTGFFHQGFNWTMSITNASCQLTIPGSTLTPFRPLLDPVSTNPPFENVIFSRAGFDPNRGWSLQQDVSTTVVQVYMDTEAHTADIVNFPNPTPALQEAMQTELVYMQKWLQ